jgi:hypothetical protein
MTITGTDVITGSDNDQINFQDIKGFGALQATIKGGMLIYTIFTD